MLLKAKAKVNIIFNGIHYPQGEMIIGEFNEKQINQLKPFIELEEKVEVEKASTETSNKVGNVRNNKKYNK